MARRLSPRVARLLAGFLIAGGAGTAALQGCADKAPAPLAPEPVLVGVSFGLTNSFDTFAAPLRDAVRAAEGTINASGGVLGRPIRFDIVDDKSSTTDEVQKVANDFVARGVVAVIGPIGSQQVVASNEIYQRARIVQISPSATSTDLGTSTFQATADRFFFRTTPADNFQGAAVILFARRGPTGLTDAGAPDAALPDGGASNQVTVCDRLTIVNIDSSYGISMGDVIEQNFPARGGTIALRETIPDSNNQDFAAVADKVIASNPDCMTFISYDDVAVPFIRELRKRPGYAELEQRGFFAIGTDGSYTSGFLTNSRENPSDETSPSSAEGVYGTNPDTQPASTEYNEFKTIFAAYAPLEDNEAPAFAANTFDAAILIALAVQKAKTTTDGTRIRDALRDVAKRANGGRSYSPAQIGDALIAARNGENVDYRGASGNVDFDENGNVNAGFIVWRAERDPVSRKISYKTLTRFTTTELEQQVTPPR